MDSTPPRSMLILAVVIGSTIGGYLPMLFGAGIFSAWSIVGSAVGAMLFLWLAFKLYGD